MLSPRFLAFLILTGVAPTFGCRHRAALESELRVVDGLTPKASEDPRIAASTLMLTVQNHDGSAISCSGTLIGPKHVVTAAHCLNRAKYVDVYAGVQPQKLSNIRVESAVAHSNWQKNDRYDIGVILFEGNLPETLHPTNLAPTELLKEAGSLVLGGYGVTGEDKFDSGVLRQTKVEVDSFNNEEKIFKLRPHTKKGACHGDSGGPAFLDKNGSLLLVGATSGPSIDAPCDEGHGTYTNVALYQDWLDCAFSAANQPLVKLRENNGPSDCKDQNIYVLDIRRLGIIVHSPAKALPSPAKNWCAPDTKTCFPLCTNGIDTGKGWGHQPELGGPNGSCKIP